MKIRILVLSLLVFLTSCDSDFSIKGDKYSTHLTKDDEILLGPSIFKIKENRGYYIGIRSKSDFYMCHDGASVYYDLQEIEYFIFNSKKLKSTKFFKDENQFLSFLKDLEVIEKKSELIEWKNDAKRKIGIYKKYFPELELEKCKPVPYDYVEWTI